VSASIPRRNVELKARDRDPARTLRRALALGAEDRGVVAQRDTYFAVARGRLKLREQQPGEAQLVAYERPDAAEARESRYRLAPVADPGAVRDALDAALGTSGVVAKRRRVLLWEGVRIHLDEVEGAGSFVELEGVARERSGLEHEHALVARLRAELRIADEDVVAVGYADLVGLPAQAAAGPGRGADAAGDPPADAARDRDDAELLLAAAEAASRRAHAPYSGLRVGAALLAPDGSVVAAANVENASYPQSQCAEASALGVLVAAGHTTFTAAAVVAEGRDVCPPCGGCRQRLAELAGPATPVHLGRPRGPRRTVSLGELLPMPFTPAGRER
jgi:homotetrameric cytidine deaminase